MSVSLFAREKEVGFLAWTLYAPNFSLLLFFFLWKLMAYKLLYYVHTFLLRLVLERNKHWRMIVEGRLRCARFTNEQCTMRFITLHRQIYIACIRKISRIKRPVANIANVKIPAREKMATEMKRRAHQFGRNFCNLFWVDGGGGGEGGGGSISTENVDDEDDEMKDRAASHLHMMIRVFVQNYWHIFGRFVFGNKHASCCG